MLIIVRLRSQSLRTQCSFSVLPQCTCPGVVSRVGSLSLFYTHTHTHTHTHTLNLCFLLFVLIVQIVFFIWSIADAILKTISSQCKEYFITPRQSQETLWWPHEGQVLILVSDIVSDEGNEAPKLGLEPETTLKPEVGEGTHSLPL